jgi:hypothetical protein
MRVFVTGATGSVGLPVVQELLVTAEAKAIIDTPEALESLCERVSEADGVTPAAFSHDWSRLAENYAVADFARRSQCEFS